ncbi:MAG: thioredoxin domain-containing protein [Planctomycetes bacterium]|nr:thioredoxin domain-containing protein [Planctomycetota bacterium]
MPQSHDHSARSTPGFRPSPRIVAYGDTLAVVGLLLALCSTGVLAYANLSGASLPGCGGAAQGTSLAPAGWGGCAEAGASAWGQVSFGGFTLSTALVGLATYCGALVLMKLAGAGSRSTRWSMRVLLAMSIFFIAVAIKYQVWCPYCLAAHVGVLLAWIGTEIAASDEPAQNKAWLAAVATLALVVVTGGVIESSAARKRSESASAAAASVIMQKNRLSEPTADRLTAPVPTPVQAAVILPHASEPEVAARFTGRYQQGSKTPKVRIVVISDFQCADCQKLERELVQVAALPNVSLSMKHFPFCRDCNPNVPRTLHANACWAARAAEAGGIVAGESGFWLMHHWLFAKGGSFTEAELRSGVAEMGLPVDQFMAAFTGRESLDRVKADVAEAMSLGISRTPMVFVNGVECTGWESPGTVSRIVTAVLQATANTSWDQSWTDQPPRALEKYVSMWRSAPVQMNTQNVRRRGDGLAKIDLVGDYQESGTREMHAIIAEILAEGWSASFAFHHYPADPACNPSIPRKMNDRACELAKGVIAAGLIGGDAAYWKAHDQAIALGAMNPIPADIIRPLATAAQVDLGQIQDPLTTNGVNLRLSQCVASASTLSITELPTLFVNGRRVARWKGGVDSRELIRKVIIEACGNVKGIPSPAP